MVKYSGFESFKVWSISSWTLCVVAVVVNAAMLTSLKISLENLDKFLILKKKYED